ncbi:MAG TPA: hypothetical protein VF889_02780, partial [Bacteroidota bacterium]
MQERHPWIFAGLRNLSRTALAFLAIQRPAAALLVAGEPARQAARPVRIACVGTSITYGYDVVDRDRNSYPA